MNVSRSLFFAAAVLTLVACPKKDDDDAPPPPTAVAPLPPPEASAPVEINTEDSTPKPGIVALVKAEVDGREDGITGTALAVPGARASLQAPTGWTTTRGAVTVVAPADKKTQLGATNYGPEGATGKLNAVTTALGFTSCEWNPPESVTTGKSKVSATAADGICKRGTATVPAAYVAPQSEGLLVVGAWDADGDTANVFGAMRSIVKATGGTSDPTGIAACCNALRQNAKSAPPEHQGAMLFAAGACDALRNDPNGRAGLSTVRAALRGAAVPGACQ